MFNLMDNNGILNELSDVINQCIVLNNEYVKKHDELKTVYNSYASLSKQTKDSDEELNYYLYRLLNETDKKLISKSKFNCLLNEQKDWMKEFHNINNELSKLYPNTK